MAGKRQYPRCSGCGCILKGPDGRGPHETFCRIAFPARHALLEASRRKIPPKGGFYGPVRHPDVIN